MNSLGQIVIYRLARSPLRRALLLQLPHKANRLSRESTLLSHPWTVLVQHKRERCERQREESRHAARPVQAQVGVHLACEEREGRGEDGADDGRTGQHGRREDGVAVDEVIVDALEDDAEGEAEGRAGDDADNPVGRGAVGPCELQ